MKHEVLFVLGAIVLISAPFLGEGGWPNDNWPSTPPLGARLPKEVPISLFHGLADKTVPPSHVELYPRAIPRARVSRLPGRDHQLNDDLREVAAVVEALAV